MALQDGLVYLCFKSGGFIGRRTERTKYRSSCWQVADSLGDGRLLYQRIHIIRRDIENLIELLYRLGKTTKNNKRNRMLVEQVNIARIEPLRFVEMRLTLVPPASPACDISEELRNSTAIGQQLTRLLEITHGGVIILQAGVVIIALGEDGLAEIRLKREGGFGGLPRLFPQSDCWLKILCQIAARIDERE